MSWIIQLEDSTENLIIDCFNKIEAVYISWKKELDEARKNKNNAIIFALEEAFTKENAIRNYIFKWLLDFWYNNFEAEQNRKDLTYNTISSPWFTFIIEAKRLNWKTKLNSEYIKNWVNRFKNKDLSRKWSNYSIDIKKNKNIAWMLWFIIENWKTWIIIEEIKEKIITNDKHDEILNWKCILDKKESFISKNWYFEINFVT